MKHGLGHWYVEIEKQAYWRGKEHNWVNRYVLSGSDPDASDATSVITQLKGIENQIHPEVAAGEGVGFVEARAYASTGYAPFVTVPYNADLDPGSATGFAGPSYSGAHTIFAPTLETCLLVETLMTGLSSTGKPIFARKYFRGISFSGPYAAVPTQIPSTDVAGIGALCAPWKTGLGGGSWVVIGTGGRLMSGVPTVHPQLVAHQIPRGRKKKSTAAAVASGTSSGFAAGYAAGTTSSQSNNNQSESNSNNTNITVPIPIIGSF